MGPKQKIAGQWNAPQWKSEMDLRDGVLTFSVKEKKERKQKRRKDGEDDGCVALDEEKRPCLRPPLLGCRTWINNHKNNAGTADAA